MSKVIIELFVKTDLNKKARQATRMTRCRLLRGKATNCSVMWAYFVNYVPPMPAPKATYFRKRSMEWARSEEDNKSRAVDVENIIKRKLRGKYVHRR
jgi:hypothetical protein